MTVRCPHSARVRLEMADNKRDLALFNMAMDCKLWGCDLVCLKVNDVCAAGRVKGLASVTQSKPRAYGTHWMRRTKFAHIYKKTGNLRAVQLLLGHTKMDSTVRNLGVDLDDALSLSEGIDL